MTRVDQFVDAVIDHSKIAIVAMLLLTAAIGAGADQVEQSSSLDQFQSDSEESQKLDYIDANFSRGEENTTTVQIVVRDDNVLDRESLISILEYQNALTEDPEINGSLSGEQSSVSIANVVATAAMRMDRAEDLQETASEFEALNESISEERTEIEQERTAVERRADELNATAELLRGELTHLRENPDASVEASFDRVRGESNVTLDDDDYETFQQAARSLRGAESRQEAEEAYRLGTEGVLRDEYEALQDRQADLRQRASDLQERGERLQTMADRLERQRENLENVSDASLDEQLEKLRSMDDSEVESVVTTVLADDGNGNGVFSFVPTDYDPGTAQAEATMLVVTQDVATQTTVEGAAGDRIVSTQLAMQDLAADRGDGQEYLVFGAGVISDEIDRSMTDSIAIVGPLALLFVFLALVVAYRDPIDILLGLLGIFAVLVWTFGFMGWADIGFNQIFIAVPVLLIGLSIDYAIHVFMRHREEREVGEGSGSRRSMAVALGGVGIALVWVTATTAIGFLSNVTSPVPPIREFGVVSSAGIVAALLVFCVLVPALKVELDELFERFGFDRRKRAFGTGGGILSRLLVGGSVGARRIPAVVIVLALLLTVGGAAGASQVDTSFDQTDFLAEDPPGWMDELPDAMAPGDYSAKRNLEYVNERFVREDSQAQILIEGDVTAADTLERLDAAEEDAKGKNVTNELATGEADIRSPLSVMRSVAAENESFNATFTTADTDGDGIPDRDLETVYDELFAVAPDEAGSVIHREDGEYRAVRLVVSVNGDASGADVTEQMSDVAAGLDGDGLEATATGTAILNNIVQEELLDTVIESLLVTLVAVFAFLMITYRVTEGSATLGAVTLLPVVLSVAWILGTMYLLDIPFNVLTGMITSLTVGLGVAYSIHLSERYNQELSRTGDVWDAMDRAVTGTGGALLGSAATTVGGFGVLVFAILPPLQQFGQITGLTIIYAFLAAVLVLPSLLVVWTRYFGPEFAREQLASGAAPTDGEATDGERADAGTTDAESGDVAEGDRGAEATGGDAPEGDGFGGDEFVAASVVDVDRPTATRSTNARHVTPGETVTVRVQVHAGDERVVLRERVPAGQMAVAAVEPEPIDVAERDDEVFVAWDGPGEASIEYAAWVDEDVEEAVDLAFEGALLTPETEEPVRGTDSVALVDDLFERIVAQGEVTPEDLQQARASLDDGEMTREQFQRIYRAWLRWGGQDGEPPELERPTDD